MDFYIKSVKTTNLFEDIVNVIDSSYLLANKTVNYILIQRNWLIGKRIVENELTTRKDDYGKSIIKELSQKLTQKYGTGFETRNIYYFIDFYNSFPNILQSVNANSLLSWTHYKVLLQASKYKLYLPTESELKSEIEKEKNFYLEKIKK